MSPQNENLLIRVATAVVLIPLVLALIWAGGWPLTLLVAAAAGGCAYEMGAITLRSSPVSTRVLAVIAAAGIPLLFAPFSPLLTAEELLGCLVGLVILFWVVNLFCLGEDLSSVPGRVGLSMFAVLYCGAMLAPLLLLREEPAGFWWLILVLAVTFLSDTGAYAAGRAIGRRKLAPRVSPSKTWEGFAGGMVAGSGGAVAVVAVSSVLTLDGVSPLPICLPGAAVGGLVVAAFGAAGDLCESVLKRAFDVKDSGRVIPGHGGVLDRVDALLFTIPVVWLWSLVSG